MANRIFATGTPADHQPQANISSLNRNNTSVKQLFMIAKGQMLSDIFLFANAASNAGTTATLSIGAQVLNNAGSNAGPLLGAAVTNAGNYTAGSPPTVTISGGGGSGATASAIMDQAGTGVVGVKITNPGSGYTSAPSVTFSAGLAGNTATATGIICSNTTFVNGQDVKTAAGNIIPSTLALAQYMAMPVDVMVTGIYAETGVASTSGGPWYIEAQVLQTGPGEIIQ